MATLKPAKDYEDQLDFQRLKELMASDFAMDTRDLLRSVEMKKSAVAEVDQRFSCKLKGFTKLESDQGSEGSSESLIKSPESVGRVEYWRKNISFVHHQIVKIREEDSYLGKDIGEGLSPKEKLAFLHLTSQMDNLILSRSILPSSPLSGKTAIKSLH